MRSGTHLLVKRLEWGEDFDPADLPDDGEEGKDHVVLVPTWNEVRDAFARLDGSIYPGMFLYLQRNPYTDPCMSVFGGPTEYAVSLSVSGSNPKPSPIHELHYIDPTRVGDLHRFPVRGVGRAYHNMEIDEALFTPDRELVIQLVEHFCKTGEWHPDVPYIRSIDGEYDKSLSYR